MKQTSDLQKFKFDVGIKTPLVLRPHDCSWLSRLLLAGMKAISLMPKRFFRDHLRIDCNERIVEVPFVLGNLGSPAGLRILDFGCAESVVPIYLASAGARVVGVDLRDYEFQHPNFSFEKGDFLDNEFEDGVFDAVVAISAVEHCGLNVYGSQQYDRGDLKVLGEFRRILKPRGRLLLTVPFGKQHLDDELRIYDSGGLADLVSGFDVLKKEFFRKSTEGKWWLSCSEEECSGAGIHPVFGVQGVSLLLCERPR